MTDCTDTNNVRPAQRMQEFFFYSGQLKIHCVKYEKDGFFVDIWDFTRKHIKILNQVGILKTSS